MKTIAIGLGVGVLALLAIIQLRSSASADCPGSKCEGGGGFVELFNIPAIQQTDANGQFAIGADEFNIPPFTNGNVWMEWCTDSETDPWIGALEIVTEETETDCFEVGEEEWEDNLAATPAFFYPSDCEGEFDVAVAGEVVDESQSCEQVDLTVRAFVWSPFESDTELVSVVTQ